MELIKPVQRQLSFGPKVWMISRIDQASILAKHLAAQNRLMRWDSFWRHDGNGPIRPSSRKADPSLMNVPGRHLLPDVTGKVAQKLKLPAANLYSDIPLSVLAARNLPKADILHGQGNYSLPAMRRAKANGMITISDVTGQLAEIRQQQLGGEYAAHNRTYREISSFLARRRTAEAHFADAVFAPSEAVAEGLQRCGVSPSKVLLVPFTSPRCSDLLGRKRLEQTDTVIRLLYVGNLSLAKGTAHLMTAWKDLHKQFKQRVHLTLVGSAKPCVQHLISNLPEGCTWLGPRSSDEVADLMLGTDIFVFPSLSEGSSLAVMEAMAAGCAIVTTFDAGSPIKNHINGLLVPQRDPVTLGTVLSTLITNPIMRCNLGQMARKHLRNEMQTGYGARVDAAYDIVMSHHG